MEVIIASRSDAVSVQGLPFLIEWLHKAFDLTNSIVEPG